MTYNLLNSMTYLPLWHTYLYDILTSTTYLPLWHTYLYDILTSTTYLPLRHHATTCLPLWHACLLLQHMYPYDIRAPTTYVPLRHTFNAYFTPYMFSIIIITCLLLSWWRLVTENEVWLCNPHLIDIRTHFRLLCYLFPVLSIILDTESVTPGLWGLSVWTGLVVIVSTAHQMGGIEVKGSIDYVWEEKKNGSW